MFFYLFDVDVKRDGLRRQALAGTANGEFDGALYIGAFASQPDFLPKHCFMLEIADVRTEQFFKAGNRFRLVNLSFRVVRWVRKKTESQSHRAVGRIVQCVQVPSVSQGGGDQNDSLAGGCFPGTIAPLNRLFYRYRCGCMAEA